MIPEQQERQVPKGTPEQQGATGPKGSCDCKCAAAVENATGNNDIVARFNQLLKNLREAGLLEQ